MAWRKSPTSPMLCWRGRVGMKRACRSHCPSGSAVTPMASALIKTRPSIMALNIEKYHHLAGLKSMWRLPDACACSARWRPSRWYDMLAHLLAFTSTYIAPGGRASLARVSAGRWRAVIESSAICHARMRLRNYLPSTRAALAYHHRT